MTTNLYSEPTAGQLTDRQLASILSAFTNRLGSQDLRDLAECEANHLYASMQLGNSAQIAAMNEKRDVLATIISKLDQFDRNAITNIITRDMDQVRVD